jgi:hypothetical protein
MQIPIPAIVLAPHPTILFDIAINRVVSKLNGRASSQYASVRKEDTLKWTIMGLHHCEFIEIRLDPSHIIFEIESLLPFSKQIQWFIVGDIERNIYNALSALFLL